MFIMPKHGGTVLADTDSSYEDSYYYPADAACGFTNAQEYVQQARFGNFAYFFKEGAGLPDAPETVGHLDRLAAAIVSQTPDEKENSLIPPVFTYFGQFIDHDVTANTDREEGLSRIDKEELTPLNRDTVEKEIKNLRAGALNLDSVHGGGPTVGDFAEKLIRALRYHKDKSKLWAGTTHPAEDLDGNSQVIMPPNDIARDVLRLRDLLRRKIVTEEDLRKLPEKLREPFFFENGDLRKQRAILGDMRNDENLAVAQFHLAIVRLHNEIIDRAYENRDEHPDAPLKDKDALFEWGRKRTSWIYQWLIMHEYLPAIGDPETIGDITRHGPRLYNQFHKLNPPAGEGLLTLPLEFSVAAFRFGHTMARDAYDWNRFFGRPFGQPNLDEASFDLLFAFTGGGRNPMPLPGGGNAEHLPSNWPIDWTRFVGPVPDTMRDRSARKLDTRLAPNLGRMVNEAPGLMQQLAARNLRRGFLLNIPTAQACVEQLKSVYAIDVPLMTANEIAEGEMEEQIRAGGFQDATPLWFYVLKEAETLGAGQRLGPLGTRLVADTLRGLAVNDPHSYFNAAKGGENWTPDQEVRPNGINICDMATLMQAAGAMD